MGVSPQLHIFAVASALLDVANFREPRLLGTSENPQRRSSQNSFYRDCMKTPDRCRSGTPPSAENGLRGLYFGVWCYRRPTIGASPATFHTVSPRTWVNKGKKSEGPSVETKRPQV